MSSWTRLRRGLVALAALAAAVALVNTNAAQAETERGLLADPAATGYIGLCNEAGQNVIGGSINTRPFIWKAVSSTRPPRAYQGTGENAVTELYQPRPDTAPAYWSGMAMAAAAFYASAKAPAVQATYGDIPLRVMIKDFPPEVNGLYVLRMYYGKANYGLYNATYPITVIQVTGTTWRVVQGGTVDCSAAKATSSEQLTGVAGKNQVTPRAPSSVEQTVDSQRARAITGPASSPKGSHASTAAGRTAHGRAGPSSAGAVVSGTTRASATDGTGSTQAADHSGTSGTSWVVWLLLGIVVLLAIALAVVSRARRPSTPGPDV